MNALGFVYFADFKLKLKIWVQVFLNLNLYSNLKYLKFNIAVFSYFK